ncbi:ferritin-like domain-containing protein [Deinococcus peraridilitoris]|uniref:Ferritin-like domain-containing protein n=1 Tax=Deinococcus peraridilitoris (strain DSM 19664 / LMG 22246 / CIP 109416 / KR-200) TaxID=937777 RepID=L0A0N6_DEIPD|nr:ferritin-like domain-containing protein [Deinococcus peraridilitoris]AFZ67406.1 hypothetical protein Deipe_1897 [Deinococcus peraridilitoris DSM 19664]
MKNTDVEMSNAETDTTTTPNRRRQFLGQLGLMSAGAVLASCGGGVATLAQNTPQAHKPNVDTAILNFALNLEYLEAAFYAAAVGRIDDVRSIGGDARIIFPEGFDPKKGIDFEANPGVRMDMFGKTIREYAEEIAEDEIKHVKFLRAALGSAAVSRPVLDLGPAFAAAGQAASGGRIMNFNPYANALFFLLGAFIFEDVGVTAYKGAAPLVTNSDILSAAAGILAVEAYHASEIRTVLYAHRHVSVTGMSGNVTPQDGGLLVAQVVQGISNARDALDDPATDKDQGIEVGPNYTGNPGYLMRGANIVLADENAIAFSRSPREVLNIVYLMRGATKGGFFPDGVRGDFSSLLG